MVGSDGLFASRAELWATEAHSPAHQKEAESAALVVDTSKDI